MKNISGNIWVIWLKLGTSYQLRHKMTPTAVTMATVLLPSFFQAGFTPHFCLNQGLFTYIELVERCKVLWASHVLQVGPSLTPHQVKNGDICFLAVKAWSLKCYYGNITVGVVLDLTWCALLVSSFGSVTQIFLDIFLILWFIFSLASSLSISEKKGDVSTKKLTNPQIPKI